MKRNQVALAPNKYVQAMFPEEIWIEHLGDQKVTIIVSTVLGLIIGFISIIMNRKSAEEDLKKSIGQIENSQRQDNSLPVTI